MSCECYQVGGPWITYDPSCPTHGDEARQARDEREAADAALQKEREWLKGQIDKLQVEVDKLKVETGKLNQIVQHLVQVAQVAWYK